MGNSSRGITPILVAIIFGLLGVAAYFTPSVVSTAPCFSNTQCSLKGSPSITCVGGWYCSNKNKCRFVCGYPTPTPFQNNETVQPVQTEKDGCVITGCNNELCLSEEQEDDPSSICVYKPEYACYETATCEVQEDGECGWTQTEELTSCLLQYEDNNIKYVRGEVVVRFKEGTTYGEAKKLVHSLGYQMGKDDAYLYQELIGSPLEDDTELHGLYPFLKVEVEGGKEEEAIIQLSESPIVESATVSSVFTIDPP